MQPLTLVFWVVLLMLGAVIYEADKLVTKPAPTSTTVEVQCYADQHKLALVCPLPSTVVYNVNNRMNPNANKTTGANQ